VNAIWEVAVPSKIYTHNSANFLFWYNFFFWNFWNVFLDMGKSRYHYKKIGGIIPLFEYKIKW